jgi:tetratricopeptide (TPR) repeat protein
MLAVMVDSSKPVSSENARAAAEADGRPHDRATEGSEGANADRIHWEAVEDISEMLHEGRFQEALPLLRDILKADPLNAYAFHFLGVALYEVGQLEGARDAYRAALKIAPNHLGARVHLSHVLREMGDGKGAIKEGMEALSRFPNDGDAMHAIGLAYHFRADDVAARKYLEAFLETGPELEVATEVRALLVQMDGGKPESEEEPD